VTVALTKSGSGIYFTKLSAFLGKNVQEYENEREWYVGAEIGSDLMAGIIVCCAWEIRGSLPWLLKKELFNLCWIVIRYNLLRECLALQKD
jgi:hypothetical protein